MNNHVRIVGWRGGLNKIGMTMAIRLRAGISLAEAKAVTDAVLNGETVIVELPQSSDAIALADELIALGAIAPAEE